jgi:GTP diphosphokinase / guanosine-3',5'-bis(diphosphate) 3'-diphosphatase
MSRELTKDNKIKLAMGLAKQIHEGHKRISGEDYYNHVYRVYERLCDVGIKDETTLVSALLHQALDVSYELSNEIEVRFGPEVSKIVKNYKKLSNTTIERETPKNYNEKYILQTYINMADDIRTLVVRIADKIDNLSTSLVLPKEKRYSTAKKALYVYSPLARLIGMSKLAVQLENEAFKILEPGEYAKLSKYTNKRVSLIRGTLNDVEKLIKQVFRENNIHAKIQTRVKHLYGIYRKAQYMKSINRDPGNFYENVYDAAAMRIIVNSVEECYTVENLLKELMGPLPEQRDDYIKNPKRSGYQSIHNIYKISKDMRIEIQIRTQEMHNKNEFGPASHLLYKIGDKDAQSQAVEKFKDYFKENPYWSKDLNYWESEKALAEYKPSTPFSKFVYAFTPKGDIIELPKGSTIIDFAYAVHSKLGDSCIGGFVNGQMVKLTYEIADGDRVEIKTLKNRTKPSTDWLKIVKTARAKNRIRKALKE